MYIPLYILGYEYGRDEQGYLLRKRAPHALPSLGLGRSVGHWLYYLIGKRYWLGESVIRGSSGHHENQAYPSCRRTMDPRGLHRRRTLRAGGETVGARKAWPRVPDRLPYMISSSLLLVFVVNILRNELPSGAISPVFVPVQDSDIRTSSGIDIHILQRNNWIVDLII